MLDKPCTSCGEHQATKASTKGYCAVCAGLARDAWHGRMQENERLRAEQRARVQKLAQEADAAGREAAQRVEDQYYMASVIIKPGTDPVVRFLKRTEALLIESIGKGGGSRVFAPLDVPLKKRWGWAMGYAQFLKDKGHNAEADLRKMHEV